MQTLLVRGHKDPLRVASAHQTLRANLIGNNVGNLMFAHATHRVLRRPDVRVETDRLSPRTGEAGAVAGRINAEVDRVVVPLANAFRPAFRENLERMSELVERIEVPVSVVGVGVQGELDGATTRADAMSRSVERFVRAVLRHAPSIGVRGEATVDYLGRLGFGADVVDLIGCPSMFLRGPELAVPRVGDDLPGSLVTDEPVALTISPYLTEMGPASLRLAADWPALHYIAQDHLTLRLLLEGVGFGQPSTGLPTTLDHPLLASGRTRFFLDPSTWIDGLGRYRFAFGTRIHGGIAAVLAGTPAVVLAHDSRTLELARYHEIPHRLLDGEPATTDPRTLAAAADWGPMISGHPERWRRFAQFLDRHDLAHAWGPGGDRGAAFDAAVARTRYPGPVVSAGPLRRELRHRVGTPAARARNALARRVRLSR